MSYTTALPVWCKIQLSGNRVFLTGDYRHWTVSAAVDGANFWDSTVGAGGAITDNSDCWMYLALQLQNSLSLRRPLDDMDKIHQAHAISNPNYWSGVSNTLISHYWNLQVSRFSRLPNLKWSPGCVNNTLDTFNGVRHGTYVEPKQSGTTRIFLSDPKCFLWDYQKNTHIWKQAWVLMERVLTGNW